ncbi:MAG: bifunctional precorrin-2 dehydrogenase/sirohydrochlorin ferrochelatase [Deltaproteobacteria bacterium]
MRYYPVLLDLKDRACCVVGGGAVAERKVRSLVRCGARVTVISPALSAGLSKSVKAGTATCIRSGFRAGMLRGFFLAVAATDDVKVNHAVYREACRRGIQVNVVDDPAASTFIVPSSIGSNGLIISISTSGKAPCVAKQMRRELEKSFVPRYSRLVACVSRERDRLKAQEPDARRRGKLIKRFLRSRRSPR